MESVSNHIVSEFALAHPVQLIAGFIALFAFIPYILYVRNSKDSEPHMSMWIVFCTINTLALVSLVKESEPIFMALAFFVGAFITLIYVKKHSSKTMFSSMEKICMLIAFIGAIAYFMDGTFGTASAVIAMLAGTLPTLLDTWKNPKNESILGWALFGTATSINLFYALAMSEDPKTMATLLYPVGILFVDVPMAIAVLRGKILSA